MPLEIGGETLYSPQETAKELDISLVALRTFRMEKRPGFEGRLIGNVHYYTRSQIEEARLYLPKKKSRRGRGETRSKSEDALAIAS